MAAYRALHSFPGLRHAPRDGGTSFLGKHRHRGLWFFRPRATAVAPCMKIEIEIEIAAA